MRDRVVLAVDPAGATGSRLAVDRVFAVKGRGVVVTGTLRGRPLARGATLRVVPGGRNVRVREVQVHGEAVEVAETGRTALNLAGIEAADLHRGLVLTDDPGVAASDRVLVRSDIALPDRMRARIHLGTAATEVSVGRSGRDALDLGDGSFGAIVRLAEPVAVATADRAVLRRSSGTHPVVGVIVLDPAPARGISRRRQSSGSVTRLADAVVAGDPTAIAAARLELHGVLEPGDEPISLADDVAEGAEVSAVTAVGDGATLTAVRAATARSIRRQATISRDGAALTAAWLVDRMVRDGRLVRDGTEIRLPGSERHAGTDPALAAAMDRLEQALAAVSPPALAEAARSAACPPEGVRALERAGRIEVIEPDLAYAATTYRDLAARALAMAAREPLTPAAFRDATGTSRKYVVAILGDLDRRGILRRTGDGHVPGPRAPALAGPGRP